MTWTTTDRDAVSQEGRELGAFAGRRIVDNIDALVEERMPLPIVTLSGNGLNRFRNKIACAQLKWMPMLIPMCYEAHKVNVHVRAHVDKVEATVNVAAALGSTGGAIIERQLPQVVGSTASHLYSYQMSLASLQAQGVDIFPLLLGIQSNESIDPADINAGLLVINASAGDRNPRTLLGANNTIASIDGEAVSLGVTLLDASKPTARPAAGLGPMQAFYQRSSGGNTVYYLWPLLPREGPSELIDQMDIVRLGSLTIESIAIEFVRDPEPYISPLAMPTMRSQDAAQTQIASSMPARTSPEHAMFTSQDYLLGSRPQIYSIGPSTVDTYGLVEAAPVNATDFPWMSFPIDEPQPVNQQDGTDGYVRSFDLILGVFGIGNDVNQLAVDFKLELVSLTNDGGVSPLETVLKSETVEATVPCEIDREDYARNVCGFQSEVAYATGASSWHQLYGVYPDWQWYHDRMTLVRLTITEDAADVRADQVRLQIKSADGDDYTAHLHTVTWILMDSRGTQWGNKVVALP